MSAGRADRPVEDGPDWYRDAVVYELHVRAFADSDGDGVGDFEGLTQKLDYLQDLGVTALWLLPFYPSPLRDEGYDIADYRDVHPQYGTLRQFRRFLQEAHRRGLRVITELVLNHTSDQHRWFQRARRAAAGSRWRDWYVWSDDPGRYADARIIFRDFEHSNWAWDPLAGQYYWHRFYAHQPDLNYDNPDVRREIRRTVDHWFDLGVDGLRLDAVPYLFEREGTICENLPETHAFLRDLRAHVDARADGRMLLAEANQWPEDASAYFGDGDECHMAFHFPLMPRLFMGLRMEDRFPIIDILRQTPPIPPACQWAVFLRNHDELTLEMVTDEERDYMYRVYAHDPEMRVNLGIRRRLAPLLQNHRHKIELMHGLLCSLPGTPVLYYGDEIGMGDNVYLGDRDGVRTPMQWSGDRNAGFSTANPQRLYLPVIIDPAYHYETVNVAAQQDNPDSLLWWVRRLVALRRRSRVFGRGTIEPLTPDNHQVLAFLRRFGDPRGNGERREQVLVVANLSRHAQYVELDLSEFRGLNPVELFGQTQFPTVGELPYLLTLGPHTFLWLAIEESHAEHPAVTTGEGPSLTCPGSWTTLLERDARRRFEAVLPDVLRARRWFGGKGRRITAARVADRMPVPLPGGGGPDPAAAVLVVVRVEYLEGEPEHYVLPLAFLPGEAGDRFTEDHPNGLLARLRPGRGEAGVLVDAHWLPGFGHALLRLVLRRRRLAGEHGEARGVGRGRAGDLAALAGAEARPHVEVGRGEQSNTSLVVDGRVIVKTVRRLEPGENPELEVGRHLTERVRFPHAPPVVGAIEYRRGRATPATLAIAHRYVPHERDAWTITLATVERYYDAALATAPEDVPPDLATGPAHPLDLLDATPSDAFDDRAGAFLPAAELLGERVGDLHRALADDRDDPAFRPEPVTALSQRSLYQSMRNTAQRALRSLQRAVARLPEDTAGPARALLELHDEILERLAAVGAIRGGRRIRVHGDLHLGQVLSTGSDFVVIDFEGEPARSVSERRLKRPPVRDVAGMLRSFQYAACTAIPGVVARGQVPTERRAHDVLGPWANLWVAWMSAAFLRGYLAAVDGTGLLPADPAELRVDLDAHLLAKACYEISYELDHRPDWTWVPIAGLHTLLAGAAVCAPARAPRT